MLIRHSSNWENHGDGQHGDIAGNLYAQKRPGGPLDAPSSQKQEVGEQIDRRREEEFADKHHIGDSVAYYVGAISDEDIAHAEKYLLLGWPEYRTLFPMR